MEGEWDDRCKYIQGKVCALLRAKPEVFEKMVAVEEDADKFKSFLNSDSSDRMKIFFTGGAKDMQLYLDSPPPSYKKKVAYCLKVAEAKVPLKEEDMFKAMVIGDVNAPLLESLHGTLRSVYLPLIGNKGNPVALPEIALKALSDKYQTVLSDVQVSIGQTKGKTVLALPPQESLGSGGKGGKSDDKDRVHVLESAVVTWTERINMALSRDSESVFEGGKHPGPLVCLEYWTTRMTDLGDIQDQLNGPQIQKVRCARFDGSELMLHMPDTPPCLQCHLVSRC